MNINSRKTTGLIIGKFMPPHLGHQYLVDFARNYVDELNVLVCSLKSEPIPDSWQRGRITPWNSKIAMGHASTHGIISSWHQGENNDS